jgi:outer membrane protein OmpA-like peptidoglycan-associated protein
MYINNRILLSTKASGYRIFVVTMTYLMISGCASSYVVLLENKDGTTGKVIITGQKGEQVLSKANEGAPLDGSAPAAPVSKNKLDKDFSAAIAAQPTLPVSYLIYFRKDVLLTKKSKALIPKIIEEINSRQVVDISVIGHTDTVSTMKLNEKLSRQRAEKIVALLKKKGVNFRAITLESHSERNLLIPTPDNKYEPKNRRVEVLIR